MDIAAMSDPQVLLRPGKGIRPRARGDLRQSPSVHLDLGPCVRELLGERRAFAHGRAFPVDDVHRNDQEEGNAN